MFQQQHQQTLQLISSSLSQAISSSFGPIGNDKIIINAANQVLITNRGSVILESLRVDHPIAKLLLDTAKGIDQSYGDGSSSFIIMMNAALREALKFLGRESDSVIPLILSLSKVLHYFVLNDPLNELLKFSVQISNNVKTKENNVLIKARNLVKTALNGKMGNKATSFLVELVIAFIFGTSENYDLDEFSLTEICSSLIDVLPITIMSGVPLQYSKVMQGVFFEGCIIKNPRGLLVDQQNMRFIVLGCDLTGKLQGPKNQTTVTLKDSLSYQTLIENESQRANDIMNILCDSEVSVILCSGEITEENQSLIKNKGLLAIERINTDDLNQICMLSGLTQIYHLSELLSMEGRKIESYVGMVNKIQEVVHSGKFYIHFQVVEKKSERTNTKYTPRRFVILHSPTEGLCKQYRDTILKALRILKTWSEPLHINQVNYPFLSLPGGGATEMFLYNLLTDKIKNTNVENDSSVWINKAFKVLRASLLEVVNSLVNNYTGDFEVFGVKKPIGRPITLVTTLRDEIKNRKSDAFAGFFIDSSGTLQITNVVENGILEPFGIKYGILVKVIECLIQLLRIDQVVPSKSSKNV